MNHLGLGLVGLRPGNSPRYFDSTVTTPCAGYPAYINPIPPGRGWMVPSCRTKNSRHGGLSLAAAIQRGEALRRTLLEQLLGIQPGNQFATASHYHGPRSQYKEQSNYSTAQGLACRQLIPHTRMYEYTSLRVPILGSGRRLVCRINNR